MYVTKLQLLWYIHGKIPVTARTLCSSIFLFQDADGDTPLSMAIAKSSYRIIEILINTPNFDMSFTNKGTFNYLHLASKKGMKR